MKKYILIISALVSIGLTSYISYLPLNGFSQSDVSNLYSTTITPAGFTFSIWSIIYISWIYLGAYVSVKKLKIKKKRFFLLALTQLTTVIWLIAWHYGYIGVSLIIMLIILGILFYLSLLKEKNNIFRNITHLFFGWILVACIANIHIFLVYSDFYPLPIVLGIISLIIGGFINYIMMSKYKSFIPSLVFIWALVGIISNQTDKYILITSYFIIVTLTLLVIKNYKLN